MGNVKAIELHGFVRTKRPEHIVALGTVQGEHIQQLVAQVFGEHGVYQGLVRSRESGVFIEILQAGAGRLIELEKIAANLLVHGFQVKAQAGQAGVSPLLPVVAIQVNLTVAFGYFLHLLTVHAGDSGQHAGALVVDRCRPICVAPEQLSAGHGQRVIRRTEGRTGRCLRGCWCQWLGRGLVRQALSQPGCNGAFWLRRTGQ